VRKDLVWLGRDTKGGEHDENGVTNFFCTAVDHEDLAFVSTSWLGVDGRA
jgi:hypothetical protein